MFGRATITLGIGPHSSFLFVFVRLRISHASSPILVNFGQRGVTAAALLPGCAIQKSQWDSRNWAPWLGGHSESHAAA